MAQAAISKETLIKCEKILDCEIRFILNQMPQRLTLYLLSSHR